MCTAKQELLLASFSRGVVMVPRCRCVLIEEPPDLELYNCTIVQLYNRTSMTGFCLTVQLYS